MVEIRFEPADVTVFVPLGTTILAAARQAGVDYPTGCERGMCGTDPVRVSPQPPDALQAPSEHEKGTLERMGLGPEYRLSCCARLRSGALVVSLDPV